MSETLGSLRGPEGVQIGHETVDIMGGHDVPPSAQNYEVWLSYRLGGHPDLRRLIDERVARGEPFTDDINEQLYERFFSNVRLSAQIMATGERIAKELNEVVTALSHASEKTGDYSEILERAARLLDHNLDVGGLREIVSGLAAATLDMAETNRKLATRLKTSSTEVDALRSTLRQARAEALTDALTGLANRKMFDEALRLRMKEASASHSNDLCLIFGDIDFFKRFNDTWGHQTGDQIIRFIASSLQKHALPDHLVARYGGEEFAIIMPRTRLAVARTIAESIRTAIESKKLLRKSTSEDLGRVTISIGISQYRMGERAHDFIERADTCLYVSKRAGRNRITTDADSGKLSAA